MEIKGDNKNIFTTFKNNMATYVKNLFYTYSFYSEITSQEWLLGFRSEKEWSTNTIYVATVEMFDYFKVRPCCIWNSPHIFIIMMKR